MRVTVAGGGVAGLSTALALARRGMEVTVYEQADAFGEIGAGLQISPNGMRVLSALGLEAALSPLLFEPEAVEMRFGRSGRRIFRLPMQEAARRRWGAAYATLHRADLVDVLAQALRDIAPGAVHFGRSVTGWSDGADGVRVRLSDETTLQADLLVGADGLHSTIRRQMLGPQAPQYTGNAAWRATVPTEALGDDAPPPSSCIWAGAGRHAVTTYVRGGEMVNFVGMVETPDPGEEGWRISGTRADVQRDFSGWHPSIDAILNKAETFNRWSLFDRQPLPLWHSGRVVLTGDAAHPMLPSMAQGAVQALEDAWALAACLAQSGEPPETALDHFFALRQPRTARIQAGSRANARIFHRGALAGQAFFYGPMAIGCRMFPGLVRSRQDWVYGYDITREVS